MSGRRSRSHSSDDEDTPGKSKTSSPSSKRTGRRRSEEEIAPPVAPSSIKPPTSSGNPTAGGNSRRPRSKKSDDDDATVSSKQSQSTRSSGNKDDNDADGKQRYGQSRRSRKDLEAPSPQTPGGNAFDTSDDGFAADGFGGGGFADTAFAPTSFGQTTPVLDAAFAADTAFESGFGDADFGAPIFSAGFDGFGPATDVLPQPETVWDKSPLTDIPTIEPAQFTLKHKSIMTKTFHAAPVSNPANGNIFFAASTPDGIYLHEVEPSRDFVQVAAVPILSADLREKIATKYNATIKGIETIWKIVVGSHGHAKEQIAAVIDLKVLEAAMTMRVVLVWQRNGSSFRLLHVTTPPAGADFVCDVSTLQAADGLLFVGGSSPKGACIFISKPAVREAWSANFLTGSGSVLAMTVTPSKPYLVVALVDKSVTVWTYKSALDRSTTDAKASKRWLFPLCRLDYATALSDAKAVHPVTEEGRPELDEKGPDVGYCTHLTWLPPRRSPQPLMLLAVAFENGFAVFHVDLPVIIVSSAILGYQVIPEPTQVTVISATPAISPIVVKRWAGVYDSSFVSWLQYGPLVDLCIAVLLHDVTNSVARVVVYAIHFPMYIKGRSSSEMLLPCRVLANVSVPKDNASFLGGIVQSCQSLICFSKTKLSMMSLSAVSSLTSQASPLSFLGQPVTSTLPGLTSSGDPYLVDAECDGDGILYVYSTVQCDRVKDDVDATMLRWSTPMRRFWLCRAIIGDTKETCFEEEAVEQGFGDNEEVAGGAASDVICELNHESLMELTPVRIVRSSDGNVCAVLFRSALGSEAGPARSLSLECDRIALVAYGARDPAIVVVHGRDISFFRGNRPGDATGLILSLDGSSLTSFKWDSSKTFELGNACRPLVGVDGDKDYVDCRRIVLFSDGPTQNLIILGKRLRDNRACFVAGDICGVANFSSDEWSMLLPNIVSGRSAWLDEGEDVFSIVGLQGDGTGYRNFALTTSARVLILSSELSVAAEDRTYLANSSLSPLGSFAVCFSSGDNVQYLCCLEGRLSRGSIAACAQSRHGRENNILIAVRPDRVIFCPAQSRLTFSELGQDVDAIYLPVSSTRAAMLLEPMVANAVCVSGKRSQSHTVLRTVIEKFGRKVSSISHGDNEGIGPYGAGITPGVFAILSKYDLKQAASWLLTGAIKFDRSANTRVLPPWLPVGPKSKGALNADAMLHVISNGDNYLYEYIKSPEQNIASTLPRQSDPVAFLCGEYGCSALGDGKPLGALKTLDIPGAEYSESLVLQLSLTLEKSERKEAAGVLSSLSGFGEHVRARQPTSTKSSSSLAALALCCHTNAMTPSNQRGMTVDQLNVWILPLAPSLQRSKLAGRSRQRILGEKDLERAGGKEVDDSDSVWATPCNESKHVWNEGPRKEKESLLLLDSIEDWLGRRRPLIFGKEGASAAKDRGEKTLADILNQDDDSFRDKGDDLDSVKEDGWVHGIGEGRSDEANLSGYFRMSEGEDDDSSWKKDGFFDLSDYQNKAFIVGDPRSFSLRQSTSGIDEGAPGKVKRPFDLVFEASGGDQASGLVLPAPRGGSLDIGVLHSNDGEARRKASLEFWFYLPSADNMTQEIVLVRRTQGSSADNLEKIALASDKETVLWEVLLRPNGELEFRTCGGSSFVSSQQNDCATPTDNDSHGQLVRPYLAAFEHWNHVCLVLTSSGADISNCFVTMLLKGIEVASAKTSMLPPDVAKSDLNDVLKLNQVMQKSHLVFGLNHCAGFRVTELRIWACERSAYDTHFFLSEYLTAAEQKKKFKVKITNKNKKGAYLGNGRGLSPPKGMLGVKPGLFAAQSGVALSQSSSLSLKPPPKDGIKFSLEPPKSTSQKSRVPLPLHQDQPEGPLNNRLSMANVSSGFDTLFRGISSRDDDAYEMPSLSNTSAPAPDTDQDDEDIAATLWDTAIPLSQQLRPSAAAALVRGPPAARHYGGNRGGLSDFCGVERFGVGGIAVCGSEKTIVFRDNEDPPALTYPIGASGAVASDQMDDDGSEFLCCFLAKEGRMVVFELRSRTVVVELQMTTKLNFWRFLPPEAAENTLCFMLVTPVGGFHWKPLEESPRPHQVWKRGPELQGKKMVNYEEGGSNGLGGADIRSRVGLATVTRSSGGGTLEAWLLPISGDSQAQEVLDELLGACLCQPLVVDNGPFLPMIVTVHSIDDGICVNVLTIIEPKKGSLIVGEVEATHFFDESDINDVIYEPPALAMGPLPEALCVSLSNIIVVILRRNGLVAAFEYEGDELNVIAMESVDHYVIDAVMRYSAEVGGAEIVMLLSDNTNPKDARIVSFCFRSAA